MLSGQVPFQSSGSWYRSSAGFVMKRITQGDIRFEGQPWQTISSQAKSLIQGNIIWKEGKYGVLYHPQPKLTTGITDISGLGCLKLDPGLTLNWS